MDRNAKILSLRGKKSFSLIAEELGITRNVVAGVMWRANWPPASRVKSPNGQSKNKCGMGRHGPGPYAHEIITDQYV